MTLVAEKRPAGFNVPLGFYDGPEVKSIPRRIRAAAVGVWTLCGTFSANKLQDGYVGPETLRELCCTAAIRAALKATKGPDGQPDPLWIDARDGGIQFTKWVKYQRSRAEVKAYREADAERKRNERKGGKGTTTSDDPEMSDRTEPGHPPDRGTPKTKTENKEEIPTYVYESPTDSRGSAVSATPGADLVRDVVPNNHPHATLTSLRIQASELINTGTDRDTVRAALQLWCTKPGVGIGRTILASLASEVIKTQAIVLAPTGTAGSNVTAFERKKAHNAAVFASLGEPTHLEIEP